MGEQYWRKVLEREQAVSTGYTGFAIPHSVSFEASSNGICVAIAPNGIIGPENRSMSCSSWPSPPTPWVTFRSSMASWRKSCPITT